MMLVRVVGVVCVLVLAACATRLPPPPAPVRRANIELEISQARLKNGLRVVLVRDPRAREVQVTMRYRVGSVEDPADQNGVAHVVEHLMFQQVVGAQSVFAKLQGAATEFNAFTTKDATTYVARGPRSSLDALLSVEAVRVGFRCASITDSVFLREREVVQNERRQNAERSAVYQALEQAAYPPGHPYHHATIGTEESLAALTRDKACAFADAYYTPSNAVLVVSGSLSPQETLDTLMKFLGKIPARSTAATAVAAPVPVPTSGRKLEATAPLEKPTVLFTWSVPADPGLRTQIAVVFGMIASHINTKVEGRVEVVVLGDSRAQQIGLLIERDKHSVAEITEAVSTAIAEMPRILTIDALFTSAIGFTAARQNAVYRQFSTYEEGGHRDARIAAHVIAGGNPTELIAKELFALRDLSPAGAITLVEQQLAIEKATIVTLTPDETGTAPTDVVNSPPVHDLGLRRDDVDPAMATRPADALPPIDDTSLLATSAGATEAATRGKRAAGGPRVRTLANGMRVVLLPLTSVPTVDARLIFSAGTGDEPSLKHGAALVAGYGLSFNERHFSDVLEFFRAGGIVDVSVLADSTEFAVGGVDMHLDFLLAGLRRLAREGQYKLSSRSITTAIRKAAKEQATDDVGALTDAWNTARFGPNHPYALGGLVRHASPLLTVADARTFRTENFVPARATLVISGKFDADNADKWIDYLFADWTAPPSDGMPRVADVPRPQPASLATDAAGTQIDLLLSIPAPAGDRAVQLVGAEMLASVVDDVRHQLGASYGLNAHLDERRLAQSYVVTGRVLAPRMGEALTLIRDRLKAFRDDADVRARAFVAARSRALAKLTADAVTAGELSASVATDVSLDRPPLSARATARAVHALTIDRITPVISVLDLSNAAIAMRGPAADIDGAFSTVGRTPTRVAAIEAPAISLAPAADDDGDDDFVRPDEIEDALTSTPETTGLSFGVVPALSYGSIRDTDMSGFSVAATAGYRFGKSVAGLRMTVGSMDGEYNIGQRLSPEYVKLSIVPVSAQVFIRGSWSVFYAGVLGGIELDRVTDGELVPTWQTGAALAFEAGVDVWRIGPHIVTAYGSAGSELLSGTDLATFLLGAGYRLEL